MTYKLLLPTLFGLAFIQLLAAQAPPKLDTVTEGKPTCREVNGLCIEHCECNGGLDKGQYDCPPGERCCIFIPKPRFVLDRCYKRPPSVSCEDAGGSCENPDSCHACDGVWNKNLYCPAPEKCCLPRVKPGWEACLKVPDACDPEHGQCVDPFSCGCFGGTYHIEYTCERGTYCCVRNNNTFTVANDWEPCREKCEPNHGQCISSVVYSCASGYQPQYRCPKGKACCPGCPPKSPNTLIWDPAKFPERCDDKPHTAGKWYGCSTDCPAQLKVPDLFCPGISVCCITIG